MWVPFDSKAGDSRLLCKNLPLHLFDNGLGGRVQGERLICVLVVHVVSDTDELALFVAAAQQDDGDADDFAVGDTR